jgi:hypothetical protein
MKSLSSHIKHITEIQNEDYYDSLTYEEKEIFDKSTFFIWEKLGLSFDLIPIINKHKTSFKGIKGRRLYNALIEIIPKGKYQFIQLKKKKKLHYNDELLKLLIKEYCCSSNEAKEFIDIYIELGIEEAEFKILKKKYGQN